MLPTMLSHDFIYLFLFVSQDHLFAPEADSMYSKNHASYVSVEVSVHPLCFLVLWLIADAHQFQQFLSPTRVLSILQKERPDQDTFKEWQQL